MPLEYTPEQLYSNKVDTLVKRLRDSGEYSTLLLGVEEPAKFIRAVAPLEDLVPSHNAVEQSRGLSVIRWLAADRLGDVTDARLRGRLTPYLAGEDGGVRAAAAYALRRVMPRRAVETLTEFLSQQVREDRVDALEVLGDIKGFCPVVTLTACLAHGDWNVRRRAVEELCEIEGGRTLQPLSERLKREIHVHVRNAVKRVVKATRGRLQKS